MKRIKGFVVGYDKIGRELLWTVKAKDAKSVHDNKKFTVASLHPGTMLTKPGDDVTFRVQTFGQEKELKAIDVSVGLKDPEVVESGESEPAPITFIMCEEDGNIYAWFAQVEDEDEAREFLRTASDECHFVALLKLQPKDLRRSEVFGFTEDVEAVFESVRSLMFVDCFRDAIEVFVTEAYNLGKK